VSVSPLGLCLSVCLFGSTGVLAAQRTKKKIIMRERRVRESGLKLGKQGATFSTTFMDNGRASPGLPSMPSILFDSTFVRIQ
jgi:hypothetical protein